MQGALDASAAEYRKALEIDKDYLDALIGLGRVSHLLGRDDDGAEVPAPRPIEIDPHKSEAHFAEGQTLEGLGRPVDALASYFRALETTRRRPRRSSAWRPCSSRGTSPTRRWPGSTRRCNSPRTTPRRTTAAAWPTWP